MNLEANFGGSASESFLALASLTFPVPPKTSDMAKIRMMAKAPSKNLRSPLPAAPPKFGGGSAIFEVKFVFFDQKEGIFHPVYTVLSWPVTLIFFGQSPM